MILLIIFLITLPFLMQYYLKVIFYIIGILLAIPLLIIPLAIVAAILLS